jgi:hypothetical protein
VFLIPVLLTLHNAEEAIAFRRMWPTIPGLLPEPFASFEARLSFSMMLLALAILSVAGFVLATAVVMRPHARSGWWLLLTLEVAMAINAIAHAVSALVVFRGYGPGLVTALVLNAPFATYCLARARRERWVSERAWRAAFGGGIVLHGPVLLGGLWLASH